MNEEGSGPLVDERPERSVDDEAGEGGRRPLPPLAYPLLAVLFGGTLVWSFSRVLLAVGKNQAVAIATLMALNILVASALIAYGRRVRRRPAAMPFLVLAATAVIAVGFVANFAYGDRGPEKKEGAEAEGQTVSVTAQGTKFVETDLTLRAGADVTIDFDNKDSGTQHNIAIFKGPDAQAPLLFRGSIVTGPKVARYTIKAPPPGKYFFHCDVHPQQMTGTITVNAGGGPGGPSPSAPALTAANLAFNPTTLKLTAEGGKVTIHFDNKDSGTQHNVAIFKGTDATAPVIFRAPFVTGPATKDFTFDAPPPGTYFFHCDVHPQQMTGTLTIS